MLHMPIIVFFLRSIPEGILLVFAHYVFVNARIDYGRVFLSGILLGTSSYLIRLLPIHYGVHTIIFLMIYIFLMVNINHIYVLKAISASILSVIVVFLCDWITVLIYVHLLGLSYESLFFQDSLTSALYSIPSLLMTFFIVKCYGVYRTKYRKKKEI